MNGEATVEPHHAELDLAQCKRLDQSYRELPKSHQKQRCTGRRDLDPAIAETLNDTLVSYPSWTSENSEFVASKKNAHEEALFRCEDERFELDMILESNLATIRVMELVMGELSRKTDEQRKTYHFNTHTLGGRSETVHRKAVQRLYGERTEDVLKALRRDPYNFIPVVLRRLRQKQDEWMSTQRQWNEAWREVVERNHLKALDHKAAIVKRNDVAALKAKPLRQQLKERWDEYLGWLHDVRDGGRPEAAVEPPTPYERLDFGDASALPETEHLLLQCLRKVGNIGAGDKAGMESLLTGFVRRYILGTAADGAAERTANRTAERARQGPSGTDGTEAHTGTGEDSTRTNGRSGSGVGSGDETAAMDEGEDAPAAGVDAEAQGAQTQASQSNGVSSTDTNRAAVSEATIGAEAGAAAGSAQAQIKKEAPATEAATAASSAGDGNTEGGDAKAAAPTAAKPMTAAAVTHGLGSMMPTLSQDVSDNLKEQLASKDEFLTTSRWAVFFMQYHALYERVAAIKQLCADAVAATEAKASVTEVPAAVALAMRASDVDAKNLFGTFMDMACKLIDGQVEAGVFEETMRELFTTRAYKVRPEGDCVVQCRGQQRTQGREKNERRIQ